MQTTNKMKVTEKINKKLGQIPDGSTFTYRQLNIDKEEYLAAAKAIERLIKRGTVQRASTGLFYKPKQTIFGALRPNEEELLKPYLFEGNNRVAYITGNSLYNRLGLTTQIPNSIKVASRDKRIITTIGNLKIRPIKSYVDVTADNYYLLEVLDAIKDFKKIPDRDQQRSIEVLTGLLKQFNESDKKRLIRYALKYPPRVRALLGALLSNMATLQDLDVLEKGLNPFTAYAYGIKKELLPTIDAWNIK
ncbi:MAG TPA: DUF6088 family protein [Puia sp.]|nr:DUF6088 family protein [Puia sp.]